MTEEPWYQAERDRFNEANLTLATQGHIILSSERHGKPIVSEGMFYKVTCDCRPIWKGKVVLKEAAAFVGRIVYLLDVMLSAAHCRTSHVLAI